MFSLVQRPVEQSADTTSLLCEAVLLVAGYQASQLGIYKMSTQVTRSTAEGSKKKKRGATRGDKWAKIRQAMNVAKLKGLQVSPNILRVVGDPEAVRQFTTETSTFMKQVCPLNVPQWKDMPKDVIDRILNFCKNYYELDFSKLTVERAVLKQFSKRWMDWRTSFHEVYAQFQTDKERLANRPVTIGQHQWVWLVKYFGSEEFRVRSEAAKANRKKQKLPSCGGSKSVAQYLHEMEEVGLSGNETSPNIEAVVPEYCRLFEIEKKRKDGSWVCKEAEEMYTKLVQLHYDEVEENGEDTLTIQEAYSMVLGEKSGYQCGLGPGALPLATIKKIDQLVQERAEGLAEVKNTMKEDLANLKEQITREVEEKYAEREKEIESRVKADILASLKSAGFNFPG